MSRTEYHGGEAMRLLSMASKQRENYLKHGHRVAFDDANYLVAAAQVHATLASTPTEEATHNAR